MKNDDIYTLKIDAYTPETIPMERLAEYLLELSHLFGEKDSVHFNGLEAGSTKVQSRVQYEAAPKVRRALSAAQAGDPAHKATKSYKKMNEMLRKDRAGADLLCNGAQVLSFTGGREPRPMQMGPFTQAIVKEGVLVRIGGKDETAHALIEDREGLIWSFAVSRALAQQLASCLFGDPIRLVGHGRCQRDSYGEWQYNDLKADEFERLDAACLIDVVEKIRRLYENLETPDNVIALMQSLRDDEESVW